MESGSNSYTNLASAIETIVKSVLNLDLVPHNSNSNRPSDEFVTYSLTSPYLPNSVNHSIEDGFSVEVSLAIHGSHEQENNLNALKLRSVFERFSIQDELKAKDIYFERIIGHYTQPQLMLGESYEHIVRLDLRFGIMPSNLEVDTDVIDEITISKEEN